jgi:hypothetical protein
MAIRYELCGLCRPRALPGFAVYRKLIRAYYLRTNCANVFCTPMMSAPRLNSRSYGLGLPEMQIFISASISNVPAVSTEKWLIDL